MNLPDWIVVASVLAALFIGVGNWIVDARRRSGEKAEIRRSYAILLAQEIRLARQQSREVRRLLEESRFGPAVAEDTGQPINIFTNPFAGEQGMLLTLSEMGLLVHSTEWAKFMPSDTIRLACSVVNCVSGWNEKARLLRSRAPRRMLPADVGDDLVFILDRLQAKSIKLLKRLNELAK